MENFNPGFILPIGTLGTGKSTFMNRLLGVDDAKTKDDPNAFYAARSVKGVTVKFPVI